MTTDPTDDELLMQEAIMQAMSDLSNQYPDGVPNDVLEKEATTIFRIAKTVKDMVAEGYVARQTIEGVDCLRRTELALPTEISDEYKAILALLP